jgi:acyl carrier protein
LIDHLEVQGCPVTAVVHAVGLTHFARLTETTINELSDTISGKAGGAQHLHDLLGNRSLSAFVLFSSGASAWGGAQQGAYAAANAFLDALAEQRRGLGLTATCVAWGAWDGGGMLTERAAAKLRLRGVSPMAPPLAIAALGQALDHDETAVTVADIDWTRFAPSFSATRVRPLLRDLPNAQRALEAFAKVASAASSLMQRLLSLTPAERERTLLELVRAEAASVLGLASPSSLEPHRPFQELGLDSLMAVELRNRLAAATGLRLQATLLFDYPTAAGLAKLLLTISNTDSFERKLSTERAAENDQLFQILRQAHGVDAPEFGHNVLSAALKLRLIIEESSERKASALPPEPPIQLSSGQAMPRLICLPALAALSGPIQYARFASNFHDRRDVWVIPHPGYRHGQLLTKDAVELISSHGKLVLACAGDSPFALLGISAGGHVAHMIAEHLEQIGRGPIGLVLLDSYNPRHVGPRLVRALHRKLYEMIEKYGGASDASLTAQQWYMDESGLLQNWRPAPLSTQTLHVSASEAFEGMERSPSDDEDWRASWPLPHIAANAPGDHFSMIDSAVTASIVDSWLLSLGSNR